MDETDRTKDKSTAEIEAYLEDCKRDFWKSIRQSKFVLEVLGFIVLSVYAGFTIAMYFANRDSADAARNSADTARETLIVGQRPWIGPDGFPSIKVRIEKEGATESVYLDIDARVKNFGLSPALHVTALPLWPTPIADNPPSDLDAGMKNLCQQMENLIAGSPERGVAIFPNGPIAIFGAWPWKESDLDKRFAMTGCVAYKSQFTGDRIHHTALCFQSLATVRDFLDKRATSQNALVECFKGAYIAD
jgi:hypothetical protein